MIDLEKTYLLAPEPYCYEKLLQEIGTLACEGTDIALVWKKGSHVDGVLNRNMSDGSSDITIWLKNYSYGQRVSDFIVIDSIMTLFHEIGHFEQCKMFSEKMFADYDPETIRLMSIDMIAGYNNPVYRGTYSWNMALEQDTERRAFVRTNDILHQIMGGSDDWNRTIDKLMVSYANKCSKQDSKYPIRKSYGFLFRNISEAVSVSNSYSHLDETIALKRSTKESYRPGSAEDCNESKDVIFAVFQIKPSLYQLFFACKTLQESNELLAGINAQLYPFLFDFYSIDDSMDFTLKITGDVFLTDDEISCIKSKWSENRIRRNQIESNEVSRRPLPDLSSRLPSDGQDEIEGL